MPHSANQIIGQKHVIWFALIMFCIIAGLISVFVNAVFIIAGIFLLVNVFLIAKYPFYGLASYLIIFLLRPGEIWPVLAPLRVELLTGLLVLVVIILKQRVIEKRFTLPTDRLTISLVAFLFVMCLTIFSTYYKTMTVEAITDFVKILVFYFLIVSLIDTKRRFIIFMTIFVALIGYIAFDAFKQYISGAYIHTMNVDRMSSSTSAGGDPNALAATLGATIPIVAAIAIYYKNFIARTLLWGLGAAMAFLIVLTASRSGMLAFMGVLAGGFIYSKQKFITIIACVILLIGVWVMMPDQYKERYLTLSETEDINETSSGRLEIWQAGLRMIVNRPFLGVGAGAFSMAAGSGDFGYSRYMQAHSLYIQLFASTGVIGGFIWFTFIYCFIKQLRILIAKVNITGSLVWMKIFSNAFIVSTIALFISGLFGHNLYRYTWYMMAGLTMALSNISEEALPDLEI